MKKGEEIYREGQRANAVFNIITGVVKAYKTATDGGEHITAFLFSDDLFGLSEEGRCTNSTKAITPVTAYRLPVSALRSRLLRDAGLEFHVICKLIHELRETQRHAFLLARRQALSKLAMFLQLLEHLQAARGERTTEIYLPMKRSDIAEYLGMSLEAVSRAFRGLSTRGVIKSRDRQHLKIMDRSTFDKMVIRTYLRLQDRPRSDDQLSGVDIDQRDELPSPHVRLRNRHHNGRGSAPISPVASPAHVRVGSFASIPACPPHVRHPL